MFKSSASALILVTLIFSSVYAQEAVDVSSDPASGNVSSLKKGNVSLNFRDTDIQNVLRMLALKSGINIVAGPEVTGLVTIELRDVPWKRALQVILETYGYAYEQRDNIITVTTIENLQKRRTDAMLLAEQEPLTTKTFILNYAKAADVLPSIDKMKSDRGSINYDTRTNSIIVYDIPENIDIIGKVIKQLDATTPQVLIEAKIIEVNLTDTDNFGIDWTIGATVSGAARPSTWPFKNSTSNRFLPDSFPSSTDFTHGTLSASGLKAVLEMLKTRTDTNILSNPKVVTLDNTQATIEIGVEHPIPTFGANAETGELQTTGLTWRNIGINFKVTPHVNSAGYVTLDLSPEVSETTSTRSFQGIDVPLITVEKTTTTVMIKDGETLVIAGLIKDKVTDIKKKVPFLGDIPLLGHLFRKSSKETIKTDLLIFLTPHILTPDIPLE